MRIDVRLWTRAQTLPWDDLLRPGRDIIYQLLEETAPEMGRQLHQQQWRGQRRVPFNYSMPRFPDSPRKRGQYTSKGPGVWSLSSPFPEIGEALWEGLVKRMSRNPMLDWNGTALHLSGIDTPRQLKLHTDTVQMRTSTPVMSRNGQGRWLNHDDPEFAGQVQDNLEGKAKLLGLDTPQLTRIDRIGPRKGYTISSASADPRIHSQGNLMDATLTGSPEVLSAICDWGLGTRNTVGFGWVFSCV